MKWMNKLRSLPAAMLCSGTINLMLHLIIHSILGVPYLIFFLLVVVPISILIGWFYPIHPKKKY